jgi:hypothetical protein
MGVRDHPTAPRSPSQNGHAERLIGSSRRGYLDYVIVFGEAHLRRVLNGVRCEGLNSQQAQWHLLGAFCLKIGRSGLQGRPDDGGLRPGQRDKFVFVAQHKFFSLPHSIGCRIRVDFDV